VRLKFSQGEVSNVKSKSKIDSVEAQSVKKVISFYSTKVKLM